VDAGLIQPAFSVQDAFKHRRRYFDRYAGSQLGSSDQHIFHFPPSRLKAARFGQILVNEINSVSKRANERRQPAMMRPDRPGELNFPIHVCESTRSD